MFGVQPCTAANAIKGKSWPHLNTGGADTLVEEWLNTKDAPKLEVESCPNCKGTGFIYPKGIEGGGVRCKHPSLRQRAQAE